MYIGPEVLMPVASALAAVVGVALMFWRRTVAVSKASVRFVARTFSRPPPKQQASPQKRNKRKRRGKRRQ